MSSKNLCGRERRLHLFLGESAKSIDLTPRESENHHNSCTRVTPGRAPVQRCRSKRLLPSRPRVRRRRISKMRTSPPRSCGRSSPHSHQFMIAMRRHGATKLRRSSPLSSYKRAGRKRASVVLHWRRHLSSSFVPSLSSPRSSRSTLHPSNTLRPVVAQEHHPSSQSRAPCFVGRSVRA